MSQTVNGRVDCCLFCKSPEHRVLSVGSVLVGLCPRCEERLIYEELVRRDLYPTVPAAPGKP